MVLMASSSVLEYPMVFSFRMVERGWLRRKLREGERVGMGRWVGDESSSSCPTSPVGVGRDDDLGLSKRFLTLVT
jgi:hypothetical protein